MDEYVQNCTKEYGCVLVSIGKFRKRKGEDKKVLNVSLPRDMYKLAIEKVVDKHMNWNGIQDYIKFLIFEDLVARGFVSKVVAHGFVSKE